VGLKENVIIGKLIPAGTGLSAYRNIEVDGTEKAKEERYPNRMWQAEPVAPESSPAVALSFSMDDDVLASESVENSADSDSQQV
jgi:DNA-directed RNA polymerase subunit beta'